ncbi:TPA: VENN motif pre-toxin domain-containing protein, partial [Neisseria lactamica]
YLAKQYDDGKTAIDPTTGKFNPNLLPEHIKEEIKAQTGAIASVVGAAGGSLNGTSGTNTNSLFNAQAGGVLGQNAVENNLLNNEDRKKYDLLTEKILNHTASNEEKAEFERLAAKDQVSNELYRKYYSDLHRKDGKKDLTTQEAASLRSYLDIIYDDQKILDRKIKNDLYQGKEILRNGEPYYPFWLAKRDRKVREHWNNSWKEIQDARGKYKTGLATVKHFFLSEGRPIGKYEKAWNILERDKAYADSFEGRAAASTAQGIALGLEFTTRGRYLMMAIGGAQASYGTYQITQGNLEHGKANFFLGAGTMLGSVSLGGASVKKSPLAIREPIPARYNRPPTSLDVNAGRMANQFSTAHQKVTDLNILFAKPSRTVSNSKVGIQWNNGIGKQGMPWENYVGKSLPSDARLPKNFKTFDYYDSRDGLAISAKTLDTQTASRTLKPRQIYNTLKNYIDKTANFKIYSLSGVELNANTIRRREIHLAIPAQTTKEQWQQINKAIEYGKTHNVNVKVTEIK